MRPGIRRTIAAALLGLPAALLAHVLVFGGEHTLGGAMHAQVLELGGIFAFLATLVIAAGAVRRWHAAAPEFAAIAAGSAAWFAGIELMERAHGIPILLAVIAIALASWLVRTVLLAFAGVVVAIARVLHSIFAPAGTGGCPRRRPYAPRYARTLAHRLRLFSRPPPDFA